MWQDGVAAPDPFGRRRGSPHVTAGDARATPPDSAEAPSMAIAVPPSHPEASWLQATVRPKSPDQVFEVALKGTGIRVTRVGGSDVTSTWIHRGRESPLRIQDGGISVFPADGEQHVFRTRGDRSWEGLHVWIPAEQVRRVADAEGVPPVEDFGARRGFLDPSLDRLIDGAVGRVSDADGIGRELAARALILQLARILHGVSPEWHSDSGAFTEAVVRDIADYVDAHLQGRVRLSEMAALTGLSPGHFAKKLQRTVGLTAPAFVNHRRVRRALVVLADESLPLGRIADDLGFSSQSHFNRVFARLTGMTPLKARRMLVG